MKYGLDVLTPTSNPREDPWKPIMKNDYVRELFDTVDDLFAMKDAMERGNGTLKLRVVEIFDTDPTYSV